MRLVREVRSAAEEGASRTTALDRSVAWRSGTPALISIAAFTPARVVVGLILTVAASAVLMLTVDRGLALYLKQAWTYQDLALWRAITELGNSAPYALAALAAIAVSNAVGWRATRLPTLARIAQVKRYAWLLLASLALSGLVVQALKLTIGRLRPRYLFESGSYGFEPFNLDFAANAFPSGHSQTIWVVAVVVFLAWPRYGVWAGIVAALVSVSRIILTAHYASDVLMGTAVGSAIVLVLAPLFLRPRDPALEVASTAGKNWRPVGATERTGV